MTPTTKSTTTIKATICGTTIMYSCISNHNLSARQGDTKFSSCESILSCLTCSGVLVNLQLCPSLTHAFCLAANGFRSFLAPKALSKIIKNQRNLKLRQLLKKTQIVLGFYRWWMVVETLHNTPQESSESSKLCWVLLVLRQPDSNTAQSEYHFKL